MAQHYEGKAPLTLARTKNGSAVHIYARQPVPEGIRDDELERLLAEGFLVEVNGPVPELVVVPDDPGTGSPGTEPTAPVRPANVANKAAWLDYRVAAGHLTPEQRAAVTAEELTLTLGNLKDDAFMDDWATSPDRQGATTGVADPAATAAAAPADLA